MERFFGLNPPPDWNFQFSFILSFKNFGIKNILVVKSWGGSGGGGGGGGGVGGEKIAKKNTKKNHR